MIPLLLTVVSSALAALVWWPMAYPREHPRYVSPAVLADVPNVTFRGGLF